MISDRPRRTAGRTPLWTALRKAMVLAEMATRPGAPPADELIELVERPKIRRRDFFKALLAGAAGAALERGAGPWLPRVDAAAAPTIAVVGAGIAGLNAANRLRKAGYRAVIYEASSSRTGGRILSVRDVMGSGLVTEYGGEFIDSEHKDMLALVKEFGLSLIDRRASAERNLRRAFYFGGAHHTERQVIEAFRPVAARIAADRKNVPEHVSYLRPGGAVELDRMSLKEYLDRIGVSGWLRDLLLVAYVTEYGLDAEETSSLNLITLIGTDLSQGFRIFGDSDERYKVRGGNQQVTAALTRRLQDQIRMGHRLIAVRPLGHGLVLTFEKAGGIHVDVPTDFVILALPFTLLRQVDLQIDMPAIKRKAIRELGYGMNTKLMFGVRRRVWRSQGYTGELYSDLPIQTGWDSSELQPGPHGGYTFFFGGTPAVQSGVGTPAELAQTRLPDLDRVFPGSATAWSKKVARMHWPSHPWTKASYAAYKTGQWTGLRGAEAMPVGAIYFAGEHTSAESQGYMNGGAESGRIAAEALLQRLRGRKVRIAPATSAAGPAGHPG